MRTVSPGWPHPGSRVRLRRAVMPAGRRRIPGWLVWALTVLLLGALIALALAKIDLPAVARAFGDVRAGWLALALALMASSFLARAESWFAVIRAALPHTDIGRPLVTRGLLIGMAGSSVAPGRLGEAARAWIIARRAGGEPGTLATIAGTILAQTVLDLLALALLAIIALPGSAIPGARTSAIIAALAVPAIILAVVIATPALASRARLSCPPPGSLAWAGRQITAGRRGLSVFCHARTAAHATVAQLVAWALQWACCYVVILAFDLQHRATLAGAAAVLLAVNLTAVVPLTPSNVGVFQAACIAALAPFGVAASRALAYGLILQAIEVTSALALGLPSLAREGLSLGQLRQHTAQLSDSDALTPDR